MHRGVVFQNGRFPKGGPAGGGGVFQIRRFPKEGGDGGALAPCLTVLNQQDYVREKPSVGYYFVFMISVMRHIDHKTQLL